jgi:hypothetical protein
MVQRSLIGGDEWAKESENQMFDTKNEVQLFN